MSDTPQSDGATGDGPPDAGSGPPATPGPGDPRHGVDPPPAPARRNPWPRRVVGLLVAAVLLTLAARSMPWHDQLVVVWEPEGEPVQTRGVLEGDWKSDAVGFTADPEVVLDPRLAALEPGPWELERRSGAGHLVDASGTRLEPEHLEWRAGFPRVLRDMDTRAFGPALGLVLLCTVAILTRWWLLLHAAGCATTYGSAFRITYVGLFFNVLLPGTSGGDLARAYLAVRGHPERRADALVSVVLDRVLGLYAMGLVALVAVWSAGAHFELLRVPVLLAVAAMTGLALAFVNPWLRRAVRFDHWIAKLPQGERLARLDRSARELARRPGTLAAGVALSCVNHLGAAGAVWFLAGGLGRAPGLLDMVCITSVANTLTAVPLSPGGLGIGEFLFGSLFELAGAPITIGVAASVCWRLCLAAAGLVGGVVMLLPGGREVRRGYRDALRGAGDGSGDASHDGAGDGEPAA